MKPSLLKKNIDIDFLKIAFVHVTRIYKPANVIDIGLKKSGRMSSIKYQGNSSGGGSCCGFHSQIFHLQKNKLRRTRIFQKQQQL